MSGALREVYDLVCRMRRRQPLYAEPGSPAWNNAWEMLGEALPQASLGDGTDLAQYTADGDCWKYAETRRDPPQFVHCFRHRRHPMSRRPEELCVYGPPLSLEAPKEEAPC